MRPRLRTDLAAAAIIAIILLRFIAAALLPVSADEAYYWLWSKHLAAGYYDHPPAIAYVIRAGTVVFGDTAFGVRFGTLMLSLLASFFVWRAGAVLARSERVGARACLFFNLTLMVAVAMMASTPDAPSMAASAAFLYFLVKAQETEDGRWWLAAGLAAGLGLLSKYTMLFLGLGALAWMLFHPQVRRWLLTPWPWAGGILAGLVFAPNLLWNAQHDWSTFAFQFGRIGEGTGWTWRYLAEFAGAQLLLATPMLLVLGVLGLVFEGNDRRGDGFLLAALVLPAMAYFVIHALHDRVQGNWPCFLYPVLAVAGAMVRAHWLPGRDGWVFVARASAAPLALLILFAAYAQALFTPVKLGRADPLARLLAVDFDTVADGARAAKTQLGAAAVVTTDYATTGWLRFFMPGETVIETNEDRRWPDLAGPGAAILSRPLLYVAEARRDLAPGLRPFFREIAPVGEVTRRAGGVPVATYRLYRLSGWTGRPLGRLP